MSAEKCLRIYLNPSSEADSFCFLPLLNIFDSTTLCTDMSLYICDVCCVNWKVLVDESGFLKQHAVYPVQPVAEGQGPEPLSTWLSSSAAGCLLLFSFSKRLNAFTKTQRDSVLISRSLITQCSIFPGLIAGRLLYFRFRASVSSTLICNFSTKVENTEMFTIFLRCLETTNMSQCFLFLCFCFEWQKYSHSG